jgi:hypothetical protein
VLGEIPNQATPVGRIRPGVSHGGCGTVTSCHAPQEPVLGSIIASKCQIQCNLPAVVA